MLELIPSAEERQETHKMLKELPENESLFKCYRCKFIFDIYQEGRLLVLLALVNKEEVRCPRCGADSTELMCKVDAYSVYLKLSEKVKCRKGILINGVDICPICRNAVCPKCLNHVVVSWSRITGYLNDVSGWNEGKKEELIDRKRYIVSREI